MAISRKSTSTRPNDTVGCIVKEPVEDLWDVFQPLNMPVLNEKGFETSQPTLTRLTLTQPNYKGCVNGKHDKIITQIDSFT